MSLMKKTRRPVVLTVNGEAELVAIAPNVQEWFDA
jgi:hypothetical protein